MRFMVVNERLVIFVNLASAPSDSEWSAYVDAVRSRRRKQPGVRILAITEGGAPTAKQRQAAATVAKDLPCAVISDSVVARTIVTALSWLGVNVKSFSASGTDRAFDFLELSSAERTSATTAIAAMRLELVISRERLRNKR